jgi:hypothetical protein
MWMVRRSATEGLNDTDLSTSIFVVDLSDIFIMLKSCLSISSDSVLLGAMIASSLLKFWFVMSACFECYAVDFMSGSFQVSVLSSSEVFTLFCDQTRMQMPNSPFEKCLNRTPTGRPYDNLTTSKRPSYARQVKNRTCHNIRKDVMLYGVGPVVQCTRQLVEY